LANKTQAAAVISAAACVLFVFTAPKTGAQQKAKGTAGQGGNRQADYPADHRSHTAHRLPKNRVCIPRKIKAAAEQNRTMPNMHILLSSSLKFVSICSPSFQ